MPWFKVDDKLHSHMKIAEAGPAMALWVVAGSWCSDQLTDGFVPAFMCNRLMPGGCDMAEALVEAELWSEDSQNGRDGYQFNDWDDYQPTAEDVEAKRAAARERMRRVREDRKRTEGSSSRNVRANGQRSNERSSPNPVPEPDPYPTSEGQTLLTADAVSGPDFDTWWDAYRDVARGRPTGYGNRKPAERAWDKLDTDDKEVAVAAVEKYRRLLHVEDADRQKPYPAQHGSTWLNQRTFDDVGRQLADRRAASSSASSGGRRPPPVEAIS